MKVSLDGGQTWQEAEEVRVCYAVETESDPKAEVVVTATNEGLITDLIENGEITATDSETPDDFIARLG